MNQTQRNPVVSSDEWYTPKWVIEELGPFDLDPCAPITPPMRLRHSLTTNSRTVSNRNGPTQHWSL